MGDTILNQSTASDEEDAALGIASELLMRQFLAAAHASLPPQDLDVMKPGDVAASALGAAIQSLLMTDVAKAIPDLAGLGFAVGAAYSTQFGQDDVPQIDACLQAVGNGFTQAIMQRAGHVRTPGGH